MALKTLQIPPVNHEFIGQFSMLIGAVCILVGPTVYGALSFLYSDAKSRQVAETIIGLGFGALTIGFLVSLAVSAKKQITKKRDRS